MTTSTNTISSLAKMKHICKFINIIIPYYGVFSTFIQAFPKTKDPTLGPADIIYSKSFTPSLNPSASSSQIPEVKQTIYDLSAMLQGFVICQTSINSPSTEEAIDAIQGLRAGLYTPARQSEIDPPFCTNLTTSGYAVTAICGPHGTYMRSMDAGKMANQIYKFCRAEVGGAWRLGGQYIFDNRTVPQSLVQVYNIRDMELTMRLDH